MQAPDPNDTNVPSDLLFTQRSHLEFLSNNYIGERLINMDVAGAAAPAKTFSAN